MPYSFDTNIWIDLDWRKIPRDSFPSLWARVENAIDHDQIFALDMVYDEIQSTKKTDDRLAAWMKDKRKAKPEFIIASEVEIQKIAIALINKHKLISNADPFIVAAAKHKSHTLVCGEKKMKPTEKPRIPNLCEELGVPCITLLELIKNEKWSF